VQYPTYVLDVTLILIAGVVVGDGAVGKAINGFGKISVWDLTKS
jgi:hypothetical protein